MSDTLILTGLDALRAGFVPEALEKLRGKKVGLLTNPTGCAVDGTETLQVLREMDLNVTALFSPEHGPQAALEGDIEISQSPEGLPMFSLYGASRRPTPEMLQNIEILVCDLQDVGARFYTYASTLAHCIEECAAFGVAMCVLDRPNPLGGETIEGPQLEMAARSFVGYLPVPIRHGLTMGELMRLFQHHANLELDLTIVPMQNWRRAMKWPQTGLKWRRPSPNLPDFRAAAWYPGLCLLEFSGICVGRGTDAPFQILAAPWLEPENFLAALPDWPELAEIQTEATQVAPAHAIFAGENCRAIRFSCENGEPQFPVALGLATLAALKQSQFQHLDEAKWKAALPLLGSSSVFGLLATNQPDLALEHAQQSAREFAFSRSPFLLYD